MMKKNFKKLKQFEANLEALNEHKDLFMQQIIKDIAVAFFREVILRTPHKTGQLQDAWQIGEIIKIKDGYMVSIINNTEYAAYVENGHRKRRKKGEKKLSIKEEKKQGKWVEGVFMMKLSAEYIEKEGERYIQKNLNDFFRRYLNND